jgi:hypothetical protein
MVVSRVSFKKRRLYNQTDKKEHMLTDSNKDEVTIGLLTPELLMFVRMGASNPIDESCRLLQVRKLEPTLQAEK